MSRWQRRTVLVLAILSAGLWIAGVVSMALFAERAEQVAEGIDVQALHLSVLATLSTLATAVLVACWWRRTTPDGIEAHRSR